MTDLEIAAAQLPETAASLWDYVAESGPAIVAVCDRNARPVGAALEMRSESTGVALPTVDGLIHYRKITSKAPRETLQAHISDLMLHASDIRREVPDLSLVVVDDHIGSGHTKYAFTRVARENAAELPFSWVTLRGRGADHRLSALGAIARLPWRDRPEVIGVDYTDELRLVDCPTAQSEQFYSIMRSATRELIARAA